MQWPTKIVFLIKYAIIFDEKAKIQLIVVLMVGMCVRNNGVKTQTFIHVAVHSSMGGKTLFFLTGLAQKSSEIVILFIINARNLCRLRCSQLCQNFDMFRQTYFSSAEINFVVVMYNFKGIRYFLLQVKRLRFEVY